MNVVFATEYYQPFTPGGTPWSLAYLARELIDAGHGVTVVTPNYGAPARETVDGVPVVRFPFWRRLPPGASLAPARDHVNPLFHALFAVALIRAARAAGADVIHAQEKHALVGAFVAARWLGRPVYLTLRDYGLICPIATCLLVHERIPRDCGMTKLQRECAPFYLDRYIAGSVWRRLRVRAALAWLYADARVKTAFVRRVDRVIGVSAGLLDIYRDAGRIGTRPSAVAHTLVRVDRTPGDATRERRAFRLPDDPVVLYVGKRSPGKGYGVFIEAARLAAAEAPGTCFVVAGDGEGPFDAGGADIRHLGALPHDEVEKLYRAADVVVQPAVWPEPFSRVPLEAAAAGKPVVATRVGGTPEAVHDGVTGVLVERDDPKALADAIVGLLRDPATRDALGRSARAWVAERFGPAAIVRETLEAYRREEKPR